jgi:uncharacterized membrane protein YfcA
VSVFLNIKLFMELALVMLPSSLLGKFLFGWGHQEFTGFLVLLCLIYLVGIKQLLEGANQ